MIYSINMKKFACFVSLLLTAATVLAQTPREILARMEEEMDKHQEEGMAMTLRDISYGITEEQVSFRPEEFPGVRIVDKRE